MSEQRFTDCECSQAGWCERHQCEKSKHWHSMCRRRKAFFTAWEEGRGPGQQRDGPKPVPRVVPTACLHRGEVLREESCPSCRGSVRIKVFECALHGECALSSKLVSVTACAACDDYATSEAVESAAE